MNLTFHTDYWNSPELKRSFMQFLVQTFNLDLSRWDETGFWDQQYRPFSYFAGDTLVSNVCVYTMQMTIQGRQCRVAQISAVGTIPEYRRKGLSRQLTQTALEWARDSHEFFFLFADEDAYPFYRECGFRLVEEYKARIASPRSTPRLGATKLDMNNAEHRALVFRIASERTSVSITLGVSNEKLFMFWCLTFIDECIYYIEALNILVLLKRENGLVTIFDIVGKSMPTFAEIYPYICDPSDKAVEFLFIADKLNLEAPDYVKVEGNGTHLMGKFPLEGTRFILPYTSHA